MRVTGNSIPESIHIEPYAREPGTVEIRLRENVHEVTKTDEETGQTYTMQEYDEYTFILPDRPGLKEEIEENLSDWLATGRVLEVNIGASIVADMGNALSILGVQV